MKVALLSDIHGNVDALAAVLDAARAKGAERILCCGDIVGYYYAPEKCLDLLAAWKVDCVRGNHEDMLSQILAQPAAEEQIRRRYGSGLAVAREVLSSAQLEYLTQLPRTLELVISGKRVLLAHGAPWDPDYYVYPDASEEVFRRCARGSEDYVVLGHTHYQLAIRAGLTYVLNPGSVGQARGKRRGIAHWSLLDLVTGLHVHQATAYPTSRLITEAERRDPHLAYLQSVLEQDD